MDAFETVLEDGTPVLFRPISPDDKDRLRAGFERLSPESRYRRFFQPVDHLSDAQLRYLTEVDHQSHSAWIAVARDEPGQPPVGVVRWIRLPDDPAIAEGAVIVGDDYQGRGIGKILLLLGARDAIEKGVKAIRAWVQADNRPIIALLESLGAHPGRIEGGLRQLTIPLPSDPDEIPLTSGALILKAAARGEIAAAADMLRPDAARFGGEP